jgi:hypothetical protein
MQKRADEVDSLVSPCILWIHLSDLNQRPADYEELALLVLADGIIGLSLRLVYTECAGMVIGDQICIPGKNSIVQYAYL